MNRRRLAAALTGAVAVLAACDVPTNEEPVELSGPFSRLETTTTTSTTTVSPEASKEVTVYLLRTEGGATVLQDVPRSVPVDAGVEAVLRSLFTPPNPEVPAEQNLSTAIPSTARLLSATRSDLEQDRLIVDVRGLFGEQGPQGVTLRNALAQIVWTATDPTTGFNEVVFRNEGQPADALVDDLETTGEPVGRDDYSRRVS